MNFTSFVTKSSQQQKNFRAKQFEQKKQILKDPYIRRYYLNKFALQASMISLISWSGKILIQNLRGIRYFGLTPWLELAAGFTYFVIRTDTYMGVSNFTDSIQKTMNQKYERRHYFNSQYWH